MPITTIDPTSALLVIDLQNGLADAPTIEPVADIATRTGQLADAFRRDGQHVVLVNAVGRAPGRTEQGARHDGQFPDGWADLMPALGRTERDHVVSKSRWGAFHDTGLHEHLTALGVTQVVIAGVATSFGVESTARAAYDHGYHVTIATDAVTDLDAAAHAHALTHVFPRLGETGTVAEITAALAR
ncbi:isochorismatase family cysteine hydrolase [Nocardia miyunensis]|uniref:isochorismatase family cysteine hydrolase n=1 Tax=Nocardia miyunensis TaxID=282684 RepID=UPI000829CA24|nr:isochorismatase family cysteine hydrolase [Nocardia miyunensis]